MEREARKRAARARADAERGTAPEAEKEAERRRGGGGGDEDDDIDDNKAGAARPPPPHEELSPPLVYLPEDRMRENAWIAAVAYPAALVFYGWTVQKGLFWFVPEIGLFVFGLSSMVIFVSRRRLYISLPCSPCPCSWMGISLAATNAHRFQRKKSASTTMLTEFVPRRSTAGVAVNNFVRNILSCVGAVAAQPLIDLVGHGWLFTALAVFTLAIGCACIWTMQRFGPRWRKSMAVE
jgi:hypothetical protein